MAAKNRKKQQRSKKNQKSKKQIQRFEEKVEEEEEVVVVVEEKSDKEFDLEAMEKMLEEDDEGDDEIQNEVDDGNNQLDKEFLDPDDEEEENDDDDVDVIEEDEEDSVDEESATPDESDDDIDHDEDEVEESDDNDNDEDESMDEKNQIITKERKQPIIEGGDENCTVDLRNLLAINSHQVNSRLLYKSKTNKEDVTTICMDGMVKANEDYLLQKASEGCSQLLSGLWGLETEKSDAGPMAILPTYCEVVTPRELPPPAQKAETKWEKFAKERGIAPKEKRSRKVWDEATQSWAYRTGYQKATSMDDPESWPIMEVKKNDDPFENPWQRARDAKKERVEKNIMNRMKNAEMGGVLERGTARRVLKAKKEAREKGRAGGNMDLKNFTTSPAGIPMDLVEGKQRGKSLTKLALMATQTSTASMGKFDKMREGEPERRKSMSGLKKRKYESATSENVVKAESKKSMKVLENVMAGGGKAKERAIRRGQYAKGETGHDYDFDDGLGPSTYRKKKGRAGIGKMKKITKKMAK